MTARTPRRLQAVAFVSTLDRFSMPPMLTAMAHAFGVQLSTIITVASGYFLAYGLMQPLWGMISDRIGLVRTMRISMSLAAASTIVAAFAWNAVALGVTRILAGACFSAAIPASLIYIGDTVPAERRQPQVTRLMAGVALGTGLASAGAGVLAQYLSWRLMFVLTGLVALLLVAALHSLPRPEVVRVHTNALAPLLAVVRSGPTRLVLALAFLEGMVLLGVLTLLPSAVEASGASTSVAGIVTAVYGLAVLLFAQLVRRTAHRENAARLIALGACAATAGCGVLVLTRVPVVALAAAGLFGLAWVSMHSSLQTWATEVLPPVRATVVSAFAGALFLGSAVSARLAGGFAEADRYALVFGWATMLAVILGLFATLGRTRWKGEPGP